MLCSHSDDCSVIFVRIWQKNEFLDCPEKLSFLVRAALTFLLILKGQAGASPLPGQGQLQGQLGFSLTPCQTLTRSLFPPWESDGPKAAASQFTNGASLGQIRAKVGQTHEFTFAEGTVVEVCCRLPLHKRRTFWTVFTITFVAVFTLCVKMHFWVTGSHWPLPCCTQKMVCDS